MCKRICSGGKFLLLFVSTKSSPVELYKVVRHPDLVRSGDLQLETKPPFCLLRWICHLLLCRPNNLLSVQLGSASLNAWLRYRELGCNSAAGKSLVSNLQVPTAILLLSSVNLWKCKARPLILR